MSTSKARCLVNAEVKGRIAGVAASEGVAVGPVFVHARRELEPERENISEDKVEEELARFQSAVEAVVQKLSETAERLRESGSEKEAGYMAARADDVRDVASQVAADLMGSKAAGLEMLKEPSAILARNLAPSDTVRIPKGMALGFVIAEGSKTSHVSIMARSFGIPAVVGVGEALEEAFEAEVVALDGGEGYAVADPDPDTVVEFERKQEAITEEQAVLAEFKHVEARTRDGQRIEVAANIGSAEEAESALEWGAEGVGLFRTEFLFMERPELPSEEEQYGAYRKVAEAFGERPVIIRTLDVGGDKDLPGVDQPEEENPFLGWRGIRMSLDTPGLFEPQLRAILRA